MNDSINPGDKIKISYFANPNSRNWKDRIIFSLATGNLEIV
jgi:hypothetical protein